MQHFSYLVHIYTTKNQNVLGGGILETLCPSVSVHISHKWNSSLTVQPILMTFYTVVVYNQRMCIKKTRVRKKSKGD